MQDNSFQGIIRTLNDFWAEYGCAITLPYDTEMGAATSHAATIFGCLGPKHQKIAFTQGCRRPADGRYGENPNRMQYFHQYQVLLKPSPEDVQNLYLESLKAQKTQLHHDR